MGDEAHLRAGMAVVIEAGMELTIMAGGQSITLNPSGITASSPIRIGSGSPGIGSGAMPLLPLGSVATEVAQAPRSQLCALKAALGSPCCKKYAPGEEASPSKGKGKAGGLAVPCPPKALKGKAGSPELSNKGAEDVVNSTWYKNCPDTVKAEIQSKSFTADEQADIQEVLGKMGPLMQCPNQPVKKIGRTNKSITKDTSGCRADTSTMGEWFENRGAIVMTDKSASPVDFKNPRAQFKGTLAHELTHGLTNGYDPRTCKSYGDWTKNPLMKDWGKAAGWDKYLKKLKAGSVPPTSYAYTNPKEDLSESIMLYVYDPDKLKNVSVERYDFIENIFKSL